MKFDLLSIAVDNELSTWVRVLLIMLPTVAVKLLSSLFPFVFALKPLCINGYIKPR